MQIIEGNKTIALFDGFKEEMRHTLDPDHNEQNPGSNNFKVLSRGIEVFRIDRTDEMQYHTSWDWLMRVVEKVGDMYVKYNSLPQMRALHEINLFNPINRVWELVIDFIQWYNTESKPTPQ